ncbi:DUF3857 domain-containing protein [Muriicola sp. E247]|uniref:DUF3857 domain-containing protein n=1 Tax=Muriicola sp. E247 TaxID=3242730 RepID=UPI0035252E33
MNQFYILLLALMFFSIGLNGQSLKFDDINQEMLEEMSYATDSAASAAVLQRTHAVNFIYKESTGFQLITTVRKRIKIYKTEGFSYATISENLYNHKGDRETVSGLKAETYNLEDGKVVTTKLKRSETYTKERNKYYDEYTFTMPNVKEGSIIDYEYTITSPFAHLIDEIYIQYDIPIKEQEIVVTTPEFYMFQSIMKGFLTISPTYSKEARRLTYNSQVKGGYAGPGNTRSNSLDYFVYRSSYVLKDTPALKEESYVNNMDNYRGSINYELKYVQFPNSPRKEYSTTWEEVAKTIFDHDDFGRQLNYSGYFKDVLKEIIQDTDDEATKVSAIYKYVQDYMTWNGYRGYNTDKGVKAAFKERSGNIAEINLMLIAMLRGAGLMANPVLVSTRDHGIPLFPTREGFNYVVAMVSLNEEQIFLDATNKYAEPNIIPVRALNWYGKQINEDGSFSSVSLFPSKPSREVIMLTISMEEEGEIHGKMRKYYSGHSAYLFRNQYNELDEETYLENLETRNKGMLISEYEITNKEVLGETISENFEFSLEFQSTVTGDNIYFSPLFNFAMKENPFKLEERNFPIDFTFPWEERYVINIKIPEGYEVISLPEPINISLQNNMGGFVFNINKTNNSIQLMTDLKFNEAVIPAQNYEELKNFFKIIVEKEAEKVVLSKANKNENSKRSAEGR